MKNRINRTHLKSVRVGSRLLNTCYLRLFHFFVVKFNKRWEYKIRFTNFIPAALIIVLTSGLFYLFKEFYLYRWALGAMLGVFELFRIYKRKTIF